MGAEKTRGLKAEEEEEEEAEAEVERRVPSADKVATCTKHKACKVASYFGRRGVSCQGGICAEKTVC
jgi:hypothetical protein